MVLPGSHNGELYDLYADDGEWAGRLNDRVAASIDTSRAVCLTGPAGSIAAPCITRRQTNQRYNVRCYSTAIRQAMLRRTRHTPTRRATPMK